MGATVQLKSLIENVGYAGVDHLQITFADGPRTVWREKFFIRTSHKFFLSAAQQPARSDVAEDVTPLKVARINRFRSAFDHRFQQIAASAQLGCSLVVTILGDQETDAGTNEGKRVQNGGE